MVASGCDGGSAVTAAHVSIPFIAGQWSLLTILKLIVHFYFAFQSPSLRGSGRFSASDIRRHPRALVSIPFIAGQWSLQEAGQMRGRRRGAVSIPFIAGQWSLRHVSVMTFATRLKCFNPLHCGAVVASPPKTTYLEWDREMFQSPSLRGSGRFYNAKLTDIETHQGFNPLHCGAVVASACAPPRCMRRRRVSIPFIAGQWSLPEQRARKDAERRVSIPFIAGQWSLRGDPAPVRRMADGFNPLHCGAVVASRRS